MRSRGRRRAARRGAVPACPWPRSSRSSTDPSCSARRSIVTERVEGETIARRILRDDEFAAARPRLAGAVRRRPWPPLHARSRSTPSPGSSDQRPGRAVPRGPRRARRARIPPSSSGSAGSSANRPPPRRTPSCTATSATATSSSAPTACAAVLDWELAHLGDPMEDLGWLCVKAWRFGSTAPVGGFGDVRRPVRRVRGGAGAAVDPEVVRWWEVLGTLKWGDHLHHAGAAPTSPARAARSSWPPSAAGCARTSTTCSWRC